MRTSLFYLLFYFFTRTQAYSFGEKSSLFSFLIETLKHKRTFLYGKAYLEKNIFTARMIMTRVFTRPTAETRQQFANGQNSFLHKEFSLWRVMSTYETDKHFFLREQKTSRNDKSRELTGEEPVAAAVTVKQKNMTCTYLSTVRPSIIWCWETSYKENKNSIALQRCTLFHAQTSRRVTSGETI